MLKIKTGSENKERERILCCHHLFLTLISKMCFCEQRNEQIRVAMMFTSKSNRLVGFKSSIMTSFTVGFLMRYIQNCIAMRLFYSLRSMRIYAVRLIFPLCFSYTILLKTISTFTPFSSTYFPFTNKKNHYGFLLLRIFDVNKC